MTFHVVVPTFPTFGRPRHCALARETRTVPTPWATAEGEADVFEQ